MILLQITTSCMIDNITFFLTGAIVAYSFLLFTVILYPSIAVVLLGLRNWQRVSATQEQDSSKEEEAGSGTNLVNLALQEKKRSSLLALENYQNELDTRFARHQALLIQGNVKKALTTLEFYIKQLSIRYAEEAQVIIPLYKQNAPLLEKERSRSAEVYLLEHKRCMSILQEAEEYIKEMIMRGLSAEPRDILHVIELEFRFKDMLHRHDGRELRDLYPGAEHNTTEDQRAAIWEDCHRLRENMGFRLGTFDDLKEEKVQMVVDDWPLVRDDFTPELVSYFRYNKIPLPFSDKALEQGYELGAVEKSFMDNLVEMLPHLRSSEIKTIRSKFVDYEIDEFDEFIGGCLHAIERCHRKNFTPSLRDAYAHCLNATLASPSIISADIKQM